MPVTKVVWYRTNPQDADENVRLIRDVFAELAAEQPDGLRYASFRLDDGVSFVHVAVLDGDRNPLSDSAAFAKFQSGIKDRCADGPTASDATVIGSYRLLTKDQLHVPAATADHGEMTIGTPPRPYRLAVSPCPI